MSVEHRPTSPTCTRSRFLRRAAVFLARFEATLSLRARLVRTLAVIACALPAATPCEAASLIATSTSSAIFASGHKFQLHIANGYYWAVIDQDLATGPNVFSSPDAMSWTPLGSIFSFGVSTSTQRWATRFSGNTVIAFAYLNTTNIYAEIDLDTKAKALAACAVADKGAGSKPWRQQPALMAFLRGL